MDDGPAAAQAVAALEALTYHATKCSSVAQALSQTVLSPSPDVCLLEAKHIMQAYGGRCVTRPGARRPRSWPDRPDPGPSPPRPARDRRCSSLGEALRRLAEHRHSHGDGAALILQLMARLPTVLISVDDSPDVVMGAVRSGAVDFICKPLPEAKLRIIWQHVVRRGLGASWGAAPGRRPSNEPASGKTLSGSPGGGAPSDGTQPIHGRRSNETIPARGEAGLGGVLYGHGAAVRGASPLVPGGAGVAGWARDDVDLHAEVLGGLDTDMGGGNVMGTLEGGGWDAAVDGWGGGVGDAGLSPPAPSRTPTPATHGHGRPATLRHAMSMGCLPRAQSWMEVDAPSTPQPSHLHPAPHAHAPHLGGWAAAPSAAPQLGSMRECMPTPLAAAYSLPDLSGLREIIEVSFC